MKNKKILFIFFIVSLNILIFQNAIQGYIPIFKYYDEFLAVLFFPTFVLSNKIRANKKNSTILVSMLILFIVGIYSNLAYKYQPINVALEDSLIVFKFFLTYLYASVIWTGVLDDEHNRNIMLKNVKIIINIFMILTIINYIFTIWPYEYRFGIMANKLFYLHPTHFAAACVVLLAIYLICSNKSVSYYSICIMILLISTFRFKALGAVLFVLLISLYVKKVKKPISIRLIAILGIIIMISFWKPINRYYFELSDGARNLMTTTSFKIAKEYFPIGTGFATFGSYFSGINYSPLYDIYGISHIYGISRYNISYISDTFWPMIIGQFGYLGLIIYSLMIYRVFRNIQEEFEIDKLNIYLSKIICLNYLIITSISESSFVNPIAIPFAIIIAL